jgi:hypothetical protein
MYRLNGHGIDISPVHLRRLFVQEDARLSELSAEELAKQGFSDEDIEEFMKRDDPTKRLVAADPEDVALEIKRREALRDYGVPEEEIAQADLSGPITIGDKTI